MTGGRQMKKLLLLILVLGVLAILLWNCLDVAGWCRWVDVAQIAGQPGNTESDIIGLLGDPDEIANPGKVGGGFHPRPPTVATARKVYVYRRFSLGTGYWAAYIFVDGAGHVLAVHLGKS